MVEFILVIAMSSILVVGLSAMINVPISTVERQSATRDSRASSAQLALNQLEKDVRFARTVELPSAHRLDVVLNDGSTATYQWDGLAGQPLVRTHDATSLTLVRSVKDLTMTLKTCPVAIGDAGELDLNTVAVTPGEFDTFSVKPGFTLLPIPVIFEDDELLGGTSTGLLVTQEIRYRRISDAKRGGIVFKTVGLAADAAAPVEITLNAKRFGTGDLLLRIYEADLANKAPDRSVLIAAGKVNNAALSPTITLTRIPMTAVRTLKENTWYVVEVRSSSADDAAKVEYRTLDNWDAAPTSKSFLAYSNDAGVTYRPAAATLDAAQMVFSLRAEQHAVDEGEGGGSGTTIQLPVAVNFDLSVGDSADSQDIVISFPVEQNLDRVRQGHR